MKNKHLIRCSVVLLLLIYNQWELKAQAELNLVLTNPTMYEVIASIEASSDYRFIYDKQEMQDFQLTSLRLKSMEVSDILDYIQKTSQAIFMVRNKTISVRIDATKQSAKKKANNSKIPKTAKRKNSPGNIQGKVVDRETGEPLIGANVFVKDSPFATVTDIIGKFLLLGLPQGTTELTVSYLGYETYTETVTVPSGKPLELKIRLTPVSFSVGEVIVTAQAKGQAQAINKQLNARGIVNVVSAEKIQELPDVNAAEAVGRLPGVTVQRDAGEGQKIVVRGLAPKYNAVAINGIPVPSTDESNRSVDLNMISPELLGSIELSKALTANQDADAIGGRVDLKLKEAPEEFHLRASAEGGYNSISDDIGIFKGTFEISNRFLSNRLGVIVSGNYFHADRSGEEFRAEYVVTGNQNNGLRPPETHRVEMVNIQEDRERYGGGVILDFELTPTTTIKSSNFYSRLNRDILRNRTQFGTDNVNAQFRITDEERQLDLLSNMLSGNHQIGTWKIDWFGARSETRNELPYSGQLRFQHELFRGTVDPDNLFAGPDVYAGLAYVSPRDAFMYNASFDNKNSKEVEWNAGVDITVPVINSDNFLATLQFGGKYRGKERNFFNLPISERFDNNKALDYRNYNPDGIFTPSNGYISALNFLQEDAFNQEDFLNNRFGNINGSPFRFDPDKVFRESQEFFQFNVDTLYAGQFDNYDATEDIYAGYAMAEIKFSDNLTLIPGVRYEQTTISYAAFTGAVPASDEDLRLDQLMDTVTNHTYDNFFPSIHLKWKPKNWLDMRLAWTRTLSRPDYITLTPRSEINYNDGYIRYGITELRPGVSNNYDIIFSFHSNKIGLLTVGGFYKEIEDFSFEHELSLRQGSEHSPENLGFPSITQGYNLFFYINNPNIAYIRGFEFDWQTSFHYLPSPFNGLVLSLNYTFLDSDLEYVRPPNYILDLERSSRNERFYNVEEQALNAPLLQQPRHSFNVVLGYDLGGFSGRVSLQYQDEIFVKITADEELFENQRPFPRVDISLTQGITPQLKGFLNFINITNSYDERFLSNAGWDTYIDNFGWQVQGGLRFQLR